MICHLSGWAESRFSKVLLFVLKKKKKGSFLDQLVV